MGRSGVPTLFASTPVPAWRERGQLYGASFPLTGDPGRGKMEKKAGSDRQPGSAVSAARTRNCQKATALAAATLRESTPWAMGMRTM